MKVTEEKLKKSQKLVEALISKAWNDSSFKEQLVNNPKETILKEAGVSFNEESMVIVEDQTDIGVVYLNIPRKLNFDDLELSDDDLEKVAGGSGTWLGELAHGSFHFYVGIGSAVAHGIGDAFDWANENI